MSRFMIRIELLLFIIDFNYGVSIGPASALVTRFQVFCLAVLEQHQADVYVGILVQKPAYFLEASVLLFGNLVDFFSRSRVFEVVDIEMFRAAFLHRGQDMLFPVLPLQGARRVSSDPVELPLVPLLEQNQ